jgi:4a-hydroxytetrahydrobiopterin dehydratase
MTKFAQKICVACQPDAEPATQEEIDTFLIDNPEWSLVDTDNIKCIQKEYKFEDFEGALRFTNMVGEVAEQEGHHPAISTEWGRVAVKWWSHKIENLHLNDLILAARCDQKYANM